MAEVQGSKKRVVVVGGGCGGSILAQSLQFSADVVLIDPKEYFEIPWANLRAMVEPKFAERSVVNHTEYLSNVRIVVASASSITEKEVRTSEGESIPYDYLVIATGLYEIFPKTRSGRLSQYESEHDKIKAANTILVVGGGPTGVELAAEIAVDYPDKKVKLVHKGPRLLEFIGTKASKRTLDWLVKNKVEVLLNQSVDLETLSQGYTKTSSGENINFDAHFVCIGKKLSSAWLKETFLNKSVNERGQIIVDEHLRVRGHTNIFAIGDITDVKELKQGYLAKEHGHVTAKNIKLLLKGEVSEKKLVVYKPASALALVSLGRKEGVAQFPFMTISGCIPGKIKSGDLFVGKTRKELGLPAK